MLIHEGLRVEDITRTRSHLAPIYLTNAAALHWLEQLTLGTRLQGKFEKPQVLWIFGDTDAAEHDAYKFDSSLCRVVDLFLLLTSSLICGARWCRVKKVWTHTYLLNTWYDSIAFFPSLSRCISRSKTCTHSSYSSVCTSLSLWISNWHTCILFENTQHTCIHFENTETKHCPSNLASVTDIYPIQMKTSAGLTWVKPETIFFVSRINPLQLYDAEQVCWVHIFIMSIPRGRMTEELTFAHCWHTHTLTHTHTHTHTHTQRPTIVSRIDRCYKYKRAQDGYISKVSIDLKSILNPPPRPPPAPAPLRYYRGYWA